ncbi:hypothetical protein KUTeg_016490 [Tegillarca granosa]|uniref:Pentatricopeptide repeat-containing protein n=1 Tax=Tegillarca granosa TaxID=220873 RepID=A0ABQ9EL80_TEGGR|nr:hypothetical protein KUTeg_016490 [Tegillarca granosa]
MRNKQECKEFNNNKAMGVYLFGEMVISRDKKQKQIAEECFNEMKDEMEPDPYKTVHTMLFGSCLALGSNKRTLGDGGTSHFPYFYSSKLISLLFLCDTSTSALLSILAIAQNSEMHIFHAVSCTFDRYHLMVHSGNTKQIQLSLLFSTSPIRQEPSSTFAKYRNKTEISLMSVSIYQIGKINLYSLIVIF